MKAFYAGSFDPFTKGHLYVVKQAARVFEEVVLALGENLSKKRVTGAEAMVKAMRAVLQREGLTKVKVLRYEGLTVRAAQEAGADFLIRGLRNNGVDYDYEENLAAVNFKLSGLETIYFRAGETSFISSSMVRELGKYQSEVKEFLPDEVRPLLQTLKEE
jgi:pantetheine-phosphate adenylyltransferase